MAQSGPPDTLSERHRLVGYMVALGRSNVDIASALDLTPQRVAQIKSSPLFQALLMDLRSEVRGRTLDEVIERLHREAGNTLDRLVELRDGVNETVALGAARELFSRQVPVVQQVRTETTRRIVLDGRDLSRIGRVLAETAKAPLVLEAVAADEPALDDVLAVGGYR